MSNTVQRIMGEGVPEICYLTLVLEHHVKTTRNRHFQSYSAPVRTNAHKELITAVFLLGFEHVQESTFTEGVLFSISHFLTTSI